MAHRQYFKHFDPVKVAEPLLPTLCPVNGYWDPTQPIPYIPNEELPSVTPNDGEIILICSTMWDAAINFSVYRTSVGGYGNSVVTIYGENDAVIYTETKVNSSSWSFFREFPSSGGIPLSGSPLQLFKVVIKDISTTGYINQFSLAPLSGYASNGWPVLEAHFKCSSLRTLAGAFINQKYIKFIKFYGSHNYLTSLAQFCESASELVEVNLGDGMTELTTMLAIFRYATKLRVITLPATLPKVTTMQYAYQVNAFLNIDFLPTTLPLLTTLSSAFTANVAATGTMTLPTLPVCTNFDNLFMNCINVKKIVFVNGINMTGNWNVGSGCPNLEEIDMCSTSTWGVLGGSAITIATIVAPNLKKLILPSKINGLALNSGSPISLNPLLAEITQCDFSSCPGVAQTMFLTRKLTSFYQPTFKSSNGTLYGSQTQVDTLQTIEIDWVGSPCTNFDLRYHEGLSATEINRIFTALPVAGTARNINVQYSGGAATCDPTIATAKGWTVTR